MSVAELLPTKKKSGKADYIDPLWLAKILWPHVTFYDKQREIIYSVQDNDLTIVPAGNELGKDFVSAFIVLSTFLIALKLGKTCRILTTSVKDSHLDVMWGEMTRFVNSSAHPLIAKQGGPLIMNQREIRRATDSNMVVDDLLNLVVGQVSEKGEGLAGRHADVTLGVVDEASGADEEVFKQLRTWCDHILIIGNCWECDNTFKWSVKGKPGTEDVGGDRLSPLGTHYERKIIRITALDSPNVKLGLRQEANGITPTDEIIIPGVKTYGHYIRDRRNFDEIQQCVSLDADWYEGREIKLFPAEWLNTAERLANDLQNKRARREAKAIGVDCAQGGDNTSWSVVDEYGLIEQISLKTSDTTKINPQTKALMLKYNVPAGKVLYDAGGGGYNEAGRMREGGFREVQIIFFGESPTYRDDKTTHYRHQRKEVREQRYAYSNRRAEMYGVTSELFDPAFSEYGGFAVPAKYTELRRQLAAMPKRYDGEGKLYLPPKSKKSKDSKAENLSELLGHSPDEADSLVLAVFGMVMKPSPKLGRLF